MLTPQWMADNEINVLVAGHDHAYSRTKPLNAFGTIQVNAGSSGLKYYPAICNSNIFQLCYIEKKQAYLKFEVANGHLSVDARNVYQENIDRFTLPCAGGGPQ